MTIEKGNNTPKERLRGLNPLLKKTYTKKILDYLAKIYFLINSSISTSIYLTNCHVKNKLNHFFERKVLLNIDYRIKYVAIPRP